jgi:energy-coupling factor transporter ATP-binding protein EcfA2
VSVIVGQLDYRYPESDASVIRGLDLQVGDGEFACVLGVSGAGKSTLAKIVAGFLPGTEGGELSGEVVIDGDTVTGEDLTEAARRVGLVIQNPYNQLSGAKYTVREEIAFGLENLGVSRVEMVERIAGVANRLRLTHLLDRSPFELSGGQQQMVAIASMVVMNPAVLVLDEPTSQLDPAGTRLVFDVLATLSRSGMTIILFEHKLELVRTHAHSVHVLADARIALSGPPRAVLSDPAVAELGIGATRYTLAARAVPAALRPVGELPVSFGDAIPYFEGVESR